MTSSRPAVQTDLKVKKKKKLHNLRASWRRPADAMEHHGHHGDQKGFQCHRFKQKDWH